MILQCPNCQTRFRVADEKVPAKGVRIRCARCATVFRAMRKEKTLTPAPPAAPPASSTPGPSFDPFDDFAPQEEPAPSAHGDSAFFPDLEAPESQAAPASRQPRSEPDHGSLLTKDDPFSEFNLPEAPPPPPAPAPADPFDFVDDLFARTEAGAKAPSPESVSPQSRTAVAPARPELTDPFADLDGLAGLAPASLTGTPPSSRTPAPPQEDDFGDDLLSARPAPTPAPDDDPFADGDWGLSPERDTDRFLSSAPRPEQTPYSGPLTSPQHGSGPADGTGPRPPHVPDSPGMRKRRAALSVLFQLLSLTVIASAAVVALAVVRSDQPISWRHVGTPLLEAAFGSTQPARSTTLEISHLRTGVFDTVSGGELFYVTGWVRNTSEDPVASVRITTELVRGGSVVGSADSLGGLVPSAEVLHALTSRSNDELQLLLARGEAPSPLAPGERLPFGAVFAMDAREVTGARVRVTSQPGLPPALEGARARPQVALEPVDEAP